MSLVSKNSIKWDVEFGGYCSDCFDCFDWFDLGLLVPCRLFYTVDAYICEIMWLILSCYSGVPDESHKEDTSNEELKTTDETIETTEASMCLYSFQYCYMKK